MTVAVVDATTAAANLPFSSRLTQFESAVSLFYLEVELIILYKKDVEYFVVM